ncbi:iron complex transport system substrate-binding protein [Flavobacterium arsenatis]|uniref:Iron complex transport system substrate-binding protein n=1 Tax=Flavobacterium arsenatis TaxID=1484332 RepID=A0ABU1TJN4_9FLAO|nr:ABC transporter substrate-binding protein [Flavobacterium arsenatis]MDR6966194.1 iron complex transport system substrate-binding protein [Flavobacterium arsenatis]
MQSFFSKIVLFALLIFAIGCKKNQDQQGVITSEIKNEIKYASGLSIFDYGDYSILKVSNPWPNATQDYTYILKEKDAKVPDSLSQFTTIQVPIKSIVVTSTTHIPSLEMLGVENSLVGFPNLDYISSEKVRARIESGKVRELGNNQTLNTEVIIDVAPDVFIGYGIDNKNPTLDNLEKSGLKVMLNGDWNEQTPLGKAEWIKFFGYLYGLDEKANTIFSDIEKEYNTTLALAKKATSKPTILAGDMFEGTWYLPKGTSWGSLLLAQAGGNYLWNETEGTGSLSLSFETVLEKAKDADFWITSGQFSSLKEMTDSNPHYSQFKAFQQKNVYSFSSKKGKTGGILYYELAPNRPDIVLKDIVKTLHPELLPDYTPFFFERLK